jgi:ATP-binding cassette subfamily F protein 3
VLILDEPGNHLDVDTVDALIEALRDYEGTVIFTSHDRHFTGKVATCIIEVREGRVVNYNGKYEAYLEKVNEEIEAGERELATQRMKAPAAVAKAPKPVRRAARRSEKDIRKELKNVEKSIAQLDEQKKDLNTKYMEESDAAESQRLHAELATVTQQLSDAEDRWSAIQEELEALAS